LDSVGHPTPPMAGYPAKSGVFHRQN